MRRRDASASQRTHLDGNQLTRSHKLQNQRCGANARVRMGTNQREIAFRDHQWLRVSDRKGVLFLKLVGVFGSVCICEFLKKMSHSSRPSHERREPRRGRATSEPRGQLPTLCTPTSLKHAPHTNRLFAFKCICILARQGYSVLTDTRRFWPLRVGPDAWQSARLAGGDESLLL